MPETRNWRPSRVAAYQAAADTTAQGAQVATSASSSLMILLRFEAAPAPAP